MTIYRPTFGIHHELEDWSTIEKQATTRNHPSAGKGDLRAIRNVLLNSCISKEPAPSSTKPDLKPQVRKTVWSRSYISKHELA